MSPAEIVNAYFDAIRSRDVAAIRALFTADAVLTSASGTATGADAIAHWYESAALLIEPNPTVGPLIIDGNRVAVEIDLHTTIGSMLVADVFTIVGDQISRLVIYGTPDTIR